MAGAAASGAAAWGWANGAAAAQASWQPTALSFSANASVVHVNIGLMTLFSSSVVKFTMRCLSSSLIASISASSAGGNGLLTADIRSGASGGLGGASGRLGDGGSICASGRLLLHPENH